MNDAIKGATAYAIGFDGNFGSQKLSPRQLQSQHLGRLVCVEGIATRCSIVRPKVSRTVHYCEKTSVHSEMSYHDATSISGFPTSSVYPTKDLEGNPLTTEFGLSTYADHQTLVIQEMPERAPAGLLPSSVDVVLDDDLVDQCKPGDRVAIIGIYRALPAKSAGFSSGLFKSVLIANHVRHLGKSIGASSPITPGDAANIRKISKRADVFELLGRSVAPSIFGHEFIKRALVLLLLGGVEKNLENGTHIRGYARAPQRDEDGVRERQCMRYVR
jgi:DNA replication licensing factor MCM3